jgi:hypothetical protein
MSTIEEQIRAVADEAFAQTEPIERTSRSADTAVPSGAEPARLDARRAVSNRARLLTVAASLLAVTLVGGLLIAANRGTDSIATEPGTIDESSVSWVSGTLQRLPADAATFRAPADAGNFAGLRIAGADLVALEVLAGIDRPATLDDPADEWIALASGELSSTLDGASPPRSELFTQALFDPDGFTDELSFSPLDVGRYVTVDIGSLTQSFDEFTLISGADAVSNAVDDEGYLKIGTGEPGERNIASRTPLRPIGEPMQLGFDAATSMVAVDRGVDGVPSWLDGPTDSILATSPDLAAIADQLDRVDGLTTFTIRVEDFSLVPSFGGPAGPTEMVTDDTAVIDRPFSAVGTGVSGIGESARIVFVYAFADEQAATAAAPSVEATFAPDNVLWTPVGDRPWTMGSVLEFESIKTVGRTVVVTSSFPDAADRPDAGSTGGLPLFYHE